MRYEPPPPPAVIDRRVVSSSDDERPNEVRISHLASRDHWILFGEPGSGKSTVFSQAAEAAGTEVVSARAFVEGRHPAGAVAFIDALEEYRISEPGRDRLVLLAEALKSSSYRQWRIACRAISLPPADLRYLAKELGAFETWQLDLLEAREQEAILHSIGESDPRAFIRKISDMAAGPLLGNPATLKLLHTTANTSTVPIHTRGALLAEATRHMAHEVNEELPERPDRPTAGAIIAAAEKACLVLMLSARSDIWVDRCPPPGKHVVTKDDLLPSQIDTEALRHALDTPMFRGEGGSFLPTHRMVAEYLAGRALAAAVNSVDGKPAALPLARALALLSAEDGKPAPALVGAYAWFVASLANGVHRDRALEMVREAPEAILLQGDAAMLPAEHRLALLDATGRKDPWFLSGMRGSTAIGGLADEDLVPGFQAILRDPTEGPHRRTMVLEALAVGRPLKSMLPTLRKFVLDPANSAWHRRDAMTAISAIDDRPTAAVRSILNALRPLNDDGSVIVRLTSLPMLVGIDATAAEIRKVLTDYAGTKDDVMGYARALGAAIELRPIAGLFDKPMQGHRNTAKARTFEVSGIVQEALAAAIEQTPTLAAADLLRWLANAGLKRYVDPEDKVRVAIARWLDAGPRHADDLFWALHRQAHGQAWHAGYEFHRMTGRPAPRSARVETLDRLQAIKPGGRDKEAVELAFHLVASIDDDPDLYWRLWHLLERRPGAEALFERLTTSPAESWRTREKQKQRAQARQRAVVVAKDRQWITKNEAAVRSGAAVHLLASAAQIYAGYWTHLTDGEDFERILNWAGADLAEAILAGWESVVQNYPITLSAQAKLEARNKGERQRYIPVAWLDHQLRQGSSAVALPLKAAFAVLRGSYVLKDQTRRDAVDAAAIMAISNHPQGAKALLRFWKATTTPKGAHSVPYAHLFENRPAAASAIEALLLAEPSLNPQVLRSALAFAAGSLPIGRLKPLVDHALSSTLASEAQSIWAFVAFLIDPVPNEGAFQKELSTVGAHSLFDRLNHGHLLGAFEAHTEAPIERDAAVVRNLGPVYPPTDGFADHRDNMSQAVAAAIKGMASSPSAQATDALGALAASAGLGKWKDTLRHHLEAQRRLRQEAEFRPPEPVEVARALNVGPPATPADLRAVVREILADLANDIRNGDTSSWRGFWNIPGDHQARTPKEENDCRDLLTDRIRDRLIRFGVGAKRTFTETRSIDDRRADLLVIGEGAAALPLEAKRHTNREIWSAPDFQLDFYARSAGSDGHGIYLIFWFGREAGPVPLTPKGVAKIETPEALRRAIMDSLTDEQRAKLDVIVLDVSAAAPKAKKAAKSRPAKGAKRRSKANASSHRKAKPRARAQR